MRTRRSLFASGSYSIGMRSTEAVVSMSIAILLLLLLLVSPAPFNPHELSISATRFCWFDPAAASTSFVYEMKRMVKGKERKRGEERRKAADCCYEMVAEDCW
jgi:hypothetical protein